MSIRNFFRNCIDTFISINTPMIIEDWDLLPKSYYKELPKDEIERSEQEKNAELREIIKKL